MTTIRTRPNSTRQFEISGKRAPPFFPPPLVTVYWWKKSWATGDRIFSKRVWHIRLKRDNWRRCSRETSLRRDGAPAPSLRPNNNNKSHFLPHLISFPAKFSRVQLWVAASDDLSAARGRFSSGLITLYPRGSWSFSCWDLFCTVTSLSVFDWNCDYARLHRDSRWANPIRIFCQFPTKIDAPATVPPGFDPSPRISCSGSFLRFSIF
jgi:hypothetical protein